MDGHEIVYRFPEYILIHITHVISKPLLTHSLTRTVTNEIEIDKIATTTPRTRTRTWHEIKVYLIYICQTFPRTAQYSTVRSGIFT